MALKDNLGTRMKEYYEQVSKTRLTHKIPVAIRIDGKAFHTFTRGFNKPFDKILMKSMHETMEYLCKNIQGCVFGYTQSDEITLILIDYQNIDTAPWFDYEVQKMCSIAASMATLAFNKSFQKNIKAVIYRTDGMDEYIDYDGNGQLIPTEKHYANILNRAADKGAMFDARCFNIPKEEVCNLIYWRQLDATRNSIQMVAQSNFSHKELQGLSCDDIQNKLLVERNINWNNYPVCCKRGVACLKLDGNWVIEYNMPILKGEDRAFVNNAILYDESR